MTFIFLHSNYSIFIWSVSKSISTTGREHK